MEILPLKIRRRYFIGLLITFIVFAPLLVLYASGYRVTSDFRIIKTGGIYVEVPVSGASFFVNDMFEGQGSLFQKSFFIQNLVPRTYTVRIDREGYHDWRKEVDVYPQLITHGKALMLPKEPERIRLVPITATTSVATTTEEIYEEVVDTEYDALLALFAATSTGVHAFSEGATTTILYNNATTTVRELGDIGIWRDKVGLHAWWLGDEERLPYFFCELTTCRREILVSEEGDRIRHFDFLSNENQFVIVEWPDGVFVTELDTRSPQNVQPLYPIAGAQFRVVGGDIYVLDTEKLFRVEL